MSIFEVEPIDFRLEGSLQRLQYLHVTFCAPAGLQLVNGFYS